MRTPQPRDVRDELRHSRLRACAAMPIPCRPGAGRARRRRDELRPVARRGESLRPHDASRPHQTTNARSGRSPASRARHHHRSHHSRMEGASFNRVHGRPVPCCEGHIVHMKNQHGEFRTQHLTHTRVRLQLDLTAGHWLYVTPWAGRRMGTLWTVWPRAATRCGQWGICERRRGEGAGAAGARGPRCFGADATRRGLVGVCGAG